MNDLLYISTVLTYPLRYSQQFCERENKIIKEYQKIQKKKKQWERKGKIERYREKKFYLILGIHF